MVESLVNADLYHFEIYLLSYTLGINLYRSTGFKTHACIRVTVSLLISQIGSGLG
jgi:hypothetical protein